MTKSNLSKDNLRREAEAKLGKQKSVATPTTKADTSRLVQELQVHQIELEMQNEELMQARAEAEAALHQYTDLYDFAPVGYFTLKRDGTIRHVNLTGASMLGAEAERGKLIKRRFGVFVSDQSRKIFNAFFEKVFISRQKETCEVELQKNGPTPLWVHIEAACSKDGDECNFVMMDVTAHKQVEDALRDAGQQWRSTFDAAGDAICLLDNEQRILRANRAMIEMFGMNFPEMIGRHCWEIVHGTKQPFQNCPIAGMKNSRKRENIELAVGAATFDVTVDPMFDENNKLIGAVHILRDITQRKRAEEKLHSAREFLRSVQDSLSSHLAILNENGVIVQVNSRWREFGETNGLKSMDSCLGMNYLHVCDSTNGPYAEEAARVAQAIRAVLAKEKIEERIEYPCHSATEKRWFVLHITKFEDTEQSFVVLAHENITERKLAEEASRQYSEQLSAAVEIEHSLATSLDRELIYASLMKGIQRLFPDVATIFISNFDSEREMIQALRGLQDGELVDVSQLPEIHLAPEGQGTQSRVIRSRQPLIINSDLKKASQNTTFVKVPGVDDGRETQSAIYVPMLAQDKILGLIQCQSYVTDRFTEEDVRTLSLIANTAAVSIQNALLFEMSQTEIRERKQTETEQQALLDIMQGLAFSNDVGEFLPLVHSSLGRVVKAENFFISLYDSSSGLFEGIYTVDQYDPPMPPSKQEKTLTSYIFRTKAPFLSTKERFEQLVASGEVELVGTDSLSFLGVPLIASGQVIGVMAVQDYHKANVYSERDTRFMMSIAGQVALAVQRKLAEETLRASEAQYRLLAEHMNDVIWLMDIKENKFVYVSPSVYKLRGYTPEEVMSQPVSESLTPESGELIQQTLMQAFQFVQEGKEIPTIPLQIEQTCKDGTTVWTEAIANFIFDESGFPAQVIGLSRDITERVRAEEEIKKQLDELQRWHNATLGREMRVLELKREVNELLGKASQPPRYPSAESQDEK